MLEKLIKKVDDKIVKEQLSNQDINVFTGSKFTSNSTFDMNSLSTEQLIALQNIFCPLIVPFL